MAQEQPVQSEVALVILLLLHPGRAIVLLALMRPELLWMPFHRDCALVPWILQS